MVLKEPTEQLLPDLIIMTTAVTEKHDFVCAITVKNYKKWQSVSYHSQITHIYYFIGIQKEMFWKVFELLFFIQWKWTAMFNANTPIKWMMCCGAKSLESLAVWTSTCHRINKHQEEQVLPSWEWLPTEVSNGSMNKY